MDSRTRKAWEYPECPNCETDVFVHGHSHYVADYKCAACKTKFDSA